MSKELSEQLREIALNYDYQDNTTIHVIADGIEELERERDSWKASAENRLEIQWQREKRIAALLFDNARLRKALEKCSIQLTAFGFSANHADEALAKVRKPT